MFSEFNVTRFNWIWGFVQAINDIRRKYEVEKLESASIEKEKVCHLCFYFKNTFMLHVKLPPV